MTIVICLFIARMARFSKSKVLYFVDSLAFPQAIIPYDK